MMKWLLTWAIHQRGTRMERLPGFWKVYGLGLEEQAKKWNEKLERQASHITGQNEAIHGYKSALNRLTEETIISASVIKNLREKVDELEVTRESWEKIDDTWVKTAGYWEAEAARLSSEHAAGDEMIALQTHVHVLEAALFKACGMVGATLLKEVDANPLMLEAARLELVPQLIAHAQADEVRRQQAVFATQVEDLAINETQA